jgi:hypothetical protein
MTKLTQRIFLVFGVLAALGALAPLGYAFQALMDGRLRWVSKTAVVVFVRTSEPTYFWTFVCILVSGGALLLWAGVRTVREFWELDRKSTQ